MSEAYRRDGWRGVVKPRGRARTGVARSDAMLQPWRPAPCARVPLRLPSRSAVALRRAARRAPPPPCARAHRRGGDLSDWAAPGSGPPARRRAPPAEEYDEPPVRRASRPVPEDDAPRGDALATALEALDALALLGAAGGALAVIMTEQVALAALPVGLPLLALLAGRAARRRRDAAAGAERAALRRQLGELSAVVRSPALPRQRYQT